MTEPQHPTVGNILVVDDVADNRDLLSRQLRRRGYTVELAENGTDALAEIARQPPHLLILDIMMPGMPGTEVLRRVRQTYSPAELPVIMATAKDQSEDIVEALDLGANDYVTKPIDFPVLLARVQALLRTRRAAAPTESITLAEVGPGTVLGGKYRLESELGAGSFGTVYRASHLGFEQPVAVKVLQTSATGNSEALIRFRLEGRSTFRLKHPNAVAVHDFAVLDSGLAYLVMELLEGQSLEEALKGQRRLSPARAIEIALPVLDVLTEAHAVGIVHRDIKPANIFLQQTRSGELVKVLDFGIAKLMDEDVGAQNLTLDGIIGTPAYMAPERLKGAAYDGRADVYSVGVLLYQMLSGRPLFESTNNEVLALAVMHMTKAPEPLRTHCPGLPLLLESAIMETLSKDYQRRPTADQLAQSLAQAVGAELPERLRRLLGEVESAERTRAVDLRGRPPQQQISPAAQASEPPGAAAVPKAAPNATAMIGGRRLRLAADDPFAFPDLARQLLEIVPSAKVSALPATDEDLFRFPELARRARALAGTTESSEPDEPA